MSNDIQTLVHQIHDAQNRLTQLISELNKQLLDSIQTANEQNVTILSNICFTIPYSKLDSKCWSPDYYHPKSQVDAVRYVLNKRVDFDSVCKAINEMITTRKVKLSGSNQNIIILNDTTLSILQNSELGQIAVAYQPTGTSD